MHSILVKQNVAVRGFQPLQRPPAFKQLLAGSYGGSTCHILSTTVVLGVLHLHHRFGPAEGKQMCQTNYFVNV